MIHKNREKEITSSSLKRREIKTEKIQLCRATISTFGNDGIRSENKSMNSEPYRSKKKYLEIDIGLNLSWMYNSPRFGIWVLSVRKNSNFNQFKFANIFLFCQF